MPLSPPPQLTGFVPWQGYEPFEDMAGPYFFKRGEKGITAGFVAEARHMNGGGTIHGGALMTFADYALFAIATDELDQGAGVTIALNGEFTDAGVEGDVVLATGEVVRATNSMVFVRGMVTAEDRTLLSFSGIIRKLRKK